MPVSRARHASDGQHRALTHAPPLVRRLGRLDYRHAEPMMRSFTAARDAGTPDEIWLVEHPPVFTLGRAARNEHLHAPGAIPVVRTERGGQVTYHGPGQAVCYLLVDLRRNGIKVREFVDRIEAATIALLDEYGIDATRHTGAPGVYLRENPRAGDPAGPGAKIASIGIRITEGRSWHGVALNIAMDLAPFSRIDPCGYPGLVVTDMRSCLLRSRQGTPEVDEVSDHFTAQLARAFAADPAFSRTRPRRP